MKRLIAGTLVVLATLVFLFLLWYFRAIILLFVLSLFTAAAARPLIARLQERGLSLGWATAATYLSGVAILALMIVLVAQFTAGEIQLLVNGLATRYNTLHSLWLGGTPVQQSLAARLPGPQQLAEAILAQEGTVLARSAFTLLSSVAATTGAVVIVLALSIYWSIDRLHFERLWLSLLPAGRRDQAREMWHSVEESVGGYIRSELSQVLLAILLLIPGYLVIGIPYPTLLALAGAVAWLIPVAGVIFAMIPALLAGLGVAPVLGIGTALYTLAVFLGLQVLVEPRLFDYRRNHSYLLVVLLMIPLADSYGFFGLLAAPPLAVAIEHLLIVLYDQRRRPLEAAVPEVFELEENLQQLRAKAESAGGAITPQVQSLMERLAALLEQAEGLVESDAPATLSSGDARG